MAIGSLPWQREIGFNSQTVLTGSNPVLTTEGVNPETLKEKVDDSTERRLFSKVTQLEEFLTRKVAGSTPVLATEE